MVLKFFKGNIADDKVDAIVLPANTKWKEGSGASEALEIALKSIEAFEAKSLESISMVVFGNHISDIAKNAGFEVTMLPRNLEKDENEKAQLEARKKMLKDAKDVAQQFMDDQIQQGIDYFKDPKHREAALQFGVAIVKMVMKK